MRSTQQSFRTLVLTASLVTIAASMPLMLAVPLSMASDLAGGPRTEAVAASQRRETLASIVSDAARQFCKPQAAIAPARVDMPVSRDSAIGLAEQDVQRQPSLLLCLPKLIDLPPPLR